MDPTVAAVVQIGVKHVRQAISIAELREKHEEFIHAGAQLYSRSPFFESTTFNIGGASDTVTLDAECYGRIVGRG